MVVLEGCVHGDRRCYWRSAMITEHGPHTRAHSPTVSIGPAPTCCGEWIGPAKPRGQTSSTVRRTKAKSPEFPGQQRPTRSGQEHLGPLSRFPDQNEATPTHDCFTSESGNAQRPAKLRGQV